MTKDNWISVEDELPDSSGPPFSRHMVVFPNRIDNSKKWISLQYWLGKKWDVEGVTHWQPLPERPEEKDNDN